MTATHKESVGRSTPDTNTLDLSTSLRESPVYKPVKSEGNPYYWLHGRDVNVQRLKELEFDSNQLVTMFKELSRSIDWKFPLLRPSLNLTNNASVKDVINAGERFGEEYDLGHLPAAKLVERLEQSLSILIFALDIDESIYSASCQQSEFDIIIVSRYPRVEYRIFGIAHHLFRLLSRNVFLSDDPTSKHHRNLRPIADLFAATILIPKKSLRYYGSWANLTKRQLNKKALEVASNLRVPVSALNLRLLTLGELDQSSSEMVKEDVLINYGYHSKYSERPPHFSKLFLEITGLAMDKGHTSVEEMCSFLNLSFEEFNLLFLHHQLLHNEYGLFW